MRKALLLSLLLIPIIVVMAWAATTRKPDIPVKEGYIVLSQRQLK